MGINAGESRTSAFPNRVLEIVQAEELLDHHPPVDAPAPDWNKKASSLGGGHVVGMSGFDLLGERLSSEKRAASKL